ncbi:MAG: XoxI, partial [uncultured Ramlibacter sp.]
GARLRLHGDRCARRVGLGPHPRLQRHAAVEPRCRRQPHRKRRAARQGGLRAQLPHPRRRPDPRAAAGAFGLRLQLHLLDPGKPNGRGELHRDPEADAHHRWGPLVCRVERRVRLRGAARARTLRADRPGRVPERLQRAQAPLQRQFAV